MTTDPLPALPSGPVTSMSDGVARMQAIDAALAPTDGLACFNRMYLIVTQKVEASVTTGFFADPAYMSRLDVVFINLYLAAIDAYRAQPPASPRCWSALLDARSDLHFAPLQFALAGMSAHINHDLPIAVMQTSEELESAPDQGSHGADYTRVNQTLGALDQSIRESFETGTLLRIDRQAAGLENITDNFGIEAARETAWVNALALWRLRGETWLRDAYQDGLDRTAAFAGRAMLIPLP